MPGLPPQAAHRVPLPAAVALLPTTVGLTRSDGAEPAILVSELADARPAGTGTTGVLVPPSTAARSAQAQIASSSPGAAPSAHNGATSGKFAVASAAQPPTASTIDVRRTAGQ
jgi:hypothetical protein